jgi:hypothetical protein
MDLVPVDSEVSTQIATAKRYPRNVVAVRKRATEIATLDEETAASCFYSLPRAGKPIVGPSVRLAEIVASSWGNIRYGARVLDHDDQQIRAQGMCWDLESNVACTIEVARRITDRQGRTYNDDMIGVTGNAANSIALRNAVLKVVPTVVWKAVYDQARKVAIGDALTLTVRRTAAIAYFGKLGVDEARVLARLGRANVEEITLEDLEVLVGLKTALKDGDTTVPQAFAPAAAAAPQPPSIKQAAAAVAAAAATQPARAPEPAQPVAPPPPAPPPAAAAAPATPPASDGGGEGEPDPMQDMEPATRTAPAGFKLALQEPAAPRLEDELPIEPPQLQRLIDLAKGVNTKAGKRTAAVDVIERVTGKRNAAQLTRAQAKEVEAAFLEAATEGGASS